MDSCTLENVVTSLLPSSIALSFFGAVVSAAVNDVDAAEALASAELVTPGVVSREDRHEFGSVVSEDGSRLYIGVDHGGWASIESYILRDGEWREDMRVVGDPDFSANDPFLSPGGGRLYFISPRRGQYDIGYITRNGPDGWSAPVFEGDPVNSPYNEYYISFTREGDMVFASDRNAKKEGDFDIYRARSRNGGFLDAEAFPEGVNSDGYEADAFIDPDGRYLIFSSNREGGRGRGDLYASFAADAGWTAPYPLGDAINSEEHELCPFVSSDGATLYFTRGGDIYRIDASVIHSAQDAAFKRTATE